MTSSASRLIGWIHWPFQASGHVVSGNSNLCTNEMKTSGKPGYFDTTHGQVRRRETCHFLRQRCSQITLWTSGLLRFLSKNSISWCSKEYFDMNLMRYFFLIWSVDSSNLTRSWFVYMSPWGRAMAATLNSCGSCIFFLNRAYQYRRGLLSRR